MTSTLLNLEVFLHEHALGQGVITAHETETPFINPNLITVIIINTLFHLLGIKSRISWMVVKYSTPRLYL